MLIYLFNLIIFIYLVFKAFESSESDNGHQDGDRNTFIKKNRFKSDNNIMDLNDWF